MNLNHVAAALRILADALEADTPTDEHAQVAAPVMTTPPEPQPEPQPQQSTADTPAFSMFQQGAAPAAESTPTVSPEDVLAAFQTLSQKKGQKDANETVLGTLKALGLSKVSEASPEQRVQMLQTLQGALNA